MRDTRHSGELHRMPVSQSKLTLLKLPAVTSMSARTQPRPFIIGFSILIVYRPGGSSTLKCPFSSVLKDAIVPAADSTRKEAFDIGPESGSPSLEGPP